MKTTSIYSVRAEHFAKTSKAYAARLIEMLRPNPRPTQEGIC
ncbi:MAG: hypothetical protein VKK04_12800 [Synechococcales bacterium]|nr:hypothetical protein [Synechococcales bacterium]